MTEKGFVKTFFNVILGLQTDCVVLCAFAAMGETFSPNIRVRCKMFLVEDWMKKSTRT
jgi:hypothetical protein